MTTVEPEYCLSRVVTVQGIRAIPGANSIQTYLVPGWQVVDRIGAYAVGDFVIHCMINTVFPSDFAPASFLNGKPLKTKKMMGELSQGLLLPVSVIPRPVQLDEDLTAVLGLRKWVPEVEKSLYQEGKDRAPFPSFIPKTDEERVQNFTSKLSRLSGVEVTITEKRDGTSVTYIYHQGVFMVASRNHVLVGSDSSGAAVSHYHRMGEEHGLAQSMATLGKNIAIQAEITGPKIGGNRHGLGKNQLNVFNIYSIDESRYLPWEQVVKICSILRLPLVRVVFQGVIPDDQLTVDYFLKLAEAQKYENQKLAEGIVVKSNTGPRISFKAISNEYLLRYGL